MIHSKELRFGNKVQTAQGEIITVQQILHSTLIYDTQMEVGSDVTDPGPTYTMSYTVQMSEVIKEVDYQEIFPIALTPDILKKCGFRNFRREEWIFSCGGSHIDFDYIDESLRLGRPSPSRVSIKNLHHLQNFLFSFAEHELEVEL